jgi:hypothetical protein
MVSLRLCKAIFLVLGLGVPSAAWAAFAVGDIQIIDNNHILTPTELAPSQGSGSGYFNRARCECKTALVVKLRQMTADLTAANFVTVVAGAGSCLDTFQALRSDCITLLPQQVIRNLTGVEYPFNVKASDLMSNRCADLAQQSYSIFVYTSDPSDQRKWIETKKLTYTVATSTPTAPTAGKVDAGDGEAAVSFSSPNSAGATDGGTVTRDPTIKGFQVLCALENGNPAFGSPPAEPAYIMARNLCNGTPADGGVQDSAPRDSGPKDTLGAVEGPRREAGASDAGVREAGPKDAGVSDGSTPSGISSLDKSYVCSSLQTSAGTVVVGSLTNGTKYQFYVITVDNFGNPSTPTKVGDPVAPQPEEDLWKRYQRSGGQSEGGYCFVATAAYGSYDHPQVRILREFRDEVLLSSRLGQVLVLGYYGASPGPAAWLARHGALRPAARALLWPVTLGAAAYLYTSAGQKLLFLGGLVVLLCLWRRRSERRGGVS